MNTPSVKTKRMLFASLFALFVAASGPAQASTAADQAAAEALFREGRNLVTAGDFAGACPKFIESQRLDPSVGTLINIGECLEKLGKLASAWGAFMEAEGLARTRGDARQARATASAKAIEPRLSKVTITVASAGRPPGLEVRWDGRVVGEGQWGSAIPVDAGDHALEASAPGRKRWSATVKVVGAGTVSAEVPVLVVAPTGGDGPTESPRGFWGTQRIAGVTVGVAGLAGLAVGAIFGATAAGKNSDSLAHCLPNDAKKCDAEGVALRNDAFASGHASTAAFVLGGAAVAVGTIVFLTAPSASRKTGSALKRVQTAPLVGHGFGGMTLRGEW